MKPREPRMSARIVSSHLLICFVIIVLSTSVCTTTRVLSTTSQQTPRAARFSASGEDVDDDLETTTLPPPPPLIRHDRLVDKLHTFNATANSLARPKKHTLRNDSPYVEDIDENDFCSHAYVDSAYFNGYDYILTRGDRLWYYYRHEHRLSRAYDQRKFTQGDHIQGALNISITPSCTTAQRFTTRRPSIPPSRTDQAFGARLVHSQDCVEINKMRGMAVYFLHNKKRARSYYNLDFRYPNGTQRRVKSKDLPWGMKQVGLLGGNLWPAQWETYQLHRPVAFLPSRYEMVFVLNHFQLEGMNRSKKAIDQLSAPLLTWNTLETNRWNTSWKSRMLLAQNDVNFTGMFEMDGIVYAIGEKHSSPSKEREASMFEYQITEGDGRRFKDLGQSLSDFVGCPKKTKVTIEISPVLTTTTTQRPSTSTTRRPSTTSVFTTTRQSKPAMISKVLDTTTTTTSTTTSTTTRPTTTTTTTSRPIMKDEPVAKKIDEGDDSDDDEGDDDEEENHDDKDQIQSKPSPSPKANVFLSSSNSNQIYSSVSLRNSNAKIASKSENNSSSQKELPVLASHPGASIREADSILLTIFIGIVVSACIATIILAFLTISGRKKAPPRFEGARIERTIPKPTIIGLDYQQRKNSSTSSMNMMMRYDSMNSLNAIYSRVGKPLRGALGNYHRQSNLHSAPMGSDSSNARILIDSSPESRERARSSRQSSNHPRLGQRLSGDLSAFGHRPRASSSHHHHHHLPHHHNHHYRVEGISSPPPPPPPPPPDTFQSLH